jgi:hypothetical protein
MVENNQDTNELGSSKVQGDPPLGPRRSGARSFFRLELLFDLLLIIVTAVYATIAYKQWQAIDRQASLMANQLKVMEDQANNMTEQLASIRDQAKSMKEQTETLRDSLTETRILVRQNERAVRATEIQASTSQIAARTAEKSAAIAFQSQRPQVFLKTTKLSEPLTANKAPLLQFTITNSGSIAAEGVFTDITHFFDEYPFSDSLSYSRGGPMVRFALAPSADNKALLNFRSLTQEKIKTLHGGQARLYFFGRGQYKDVFGRSYPLPFCYMYNKDVDGNLIICPSYLAVN